MTNFMGMEADVRVDTDGDIWTMVMTAPKIGFEEKLQLPEGFEHFPPQQQKYWSKKLFKKLEGKLASRIYMIQKNERHLKCNPSSSGMGYYSDRYDCRCLGCWRRSKYLDCRKWSRDGFL